MLVKKLLEIDRFCILDDAAQVLESGQRVLLGVQHLLGRFLHVPVRLLGEHPAATAVSGPLPARSRRRRAEGVGGVETSASGSFTPQPCGPRGRRLLPDPGRGRGRHLHPPRAAGRLRLRPQYGGSLLQPCTELGRPGEAAAAAAARFLWPQLAATGRRGTGAAGVGLPASATPLPSPGGPLKVIASLAARILQEPSGDGGQGISRLCRQ